MFKMQDATDKINSVVVMPIAKSTVGKLLANAIIHGEVSHEWIEQASTDDIVNLLVYNTRGKQ